MNRAVCAAALTVFATSAPTVTKAQQAPESPMPAAVNICVDGASIAPTKPDGSQWRDGPRIPAALSAIINAKFDSLIAKAIVTSGVAAVVPAAVAEPLIADFAEHELVKQLEKPIVVGDVEIAPRGTFTGAKDRRRAIKPPILPIGRINPHFHVCFDHVAWAPSIALRIDLKDWHGNRSEEIGTVDVAGKTIEAVYRLGAAHHVLVHEQNPSIRSVALSVTKAR